MSSNTLHSPGPFSFKGEQMHHDHSRIIRDANGKMIGFAADFNRYDRDAEADANALLFAGSYDLLIDGENALQALRFFLAEAGGCDESVGICFCTARASADALREAIAKAKGLPLVAEQWDACNGT